MPPGCLIAVFCERSAFRAAKPRPRMWRGFDKNLIFLRHYFQTTRLIVPIKAFSDAFITACEDERDYLFISNEQGAPLLGYWLAWRPALKVLPTVLP